MTRKGKKKAQSRCSVAALPIGKAAKRAALHQCQRDIDVATSGIGVGANDMRFIDQCPRNVLLRPGKLIFSSTSIPNPVGIAPMPTLPSI